MTNILVVGGAGYIGSHTCLDLVNKGFTPVVYDNLSNGHAEFVKWGPLERGDIRDRGGSMRCSKIPARRDRAFRSTDRGRQIGEGSDRLLREQCRGNAEPAGGRPSRRCRTSWCSRPPAPPMACRRPFRWTRPIRRGRSILTGAASSSSSRCLATSTRQKASAPSCCAISMPPAPIRKGGSANGTRRKRTPSRWRSRQRSADAQVSRCLAGTTKRATAPACATSFTSWIWPTPTRGRSRYLLDGGESIALNLGTGDGTTVKELLATIGSVRQDFSGRIWERREGDSPASLPTTRRPDRSWLDAAHDLGYYRNGLELASCRSGDARSPEQGTNRWTARFSDQRPRRDRDTDAAGCSSFTGAGSIRGEMEQEKNGLRGRYEKAWPTPPFHSRRWRRPRRRRHIVQHRRHDGHHDQLFQPHRLARPADRFRHRDRRRWRVFREKGGDERRKPESREGSG